MAMEARSGGVAVALPARRPLQPRDTNVAAAVALIAGKKKAKARRPATKAEAATEVVQEVSLAEELEKARERRGRLRAAREVTERVLEERAAALRREARDWERRAEEQRRLVAELMRLIGMPEVYTPVESLRSKEERKRKEATQHSDSMGVASPSLNNVRDNCCDATPTKCSDSMGAASTSQDNVGEKSCDEQSEATRTSAASTDGNSD